MTAPLDRSFVETTLFETPVDAPRKASRHTGISWTDRTWNPVTGCDRTSPGCDNCYALTMAKRLKAMGQAKYQNDGDPRTSGPGFGVTCHPYTLDEPLRWSKPSRVFVNSMSDLFHPDVLAEGDFIQRVFATMMQSPQHTYQVLTKRPNLMKFVLGDPGFWSQVLIEAVHPDDEAESWHHRNAVLPGPLPNVWLGTSIESDAYAFRAKHLTATPAAVHFLSLEPLLGPLPSLDLTGVDWAIIGGESGPGARPMELEWARDIRDRCAEAGVPLWVKQLGAVQAQRLGLHRSGVVLDEMPEDLRIREWPACTSWEAEPNAS